MSDTKKPRESATTGDAGKELTEDELESVAGGGGSAGQPVSKAMYDWVAGVASTVPPKK